MIAKQIAFENVEELETYSGDEKVQDSDWPDLIPFGDYSGLPDFPTEALDPFGRQMVTAIADVAQVDAGLPGSLYLGILSAACHFNINLVSHKEKSNLYLNVIAYPGERKSVVESILSKPVYEFQREREAEMSETIRAAMTKKKLLDSRLQHILKQAASEEDPKKMGKLKEEVNLLSTELQNNPIPTEPTYILDDVTTEKLGLLMSQNEERMAIISSEAGIFQLIAGYYSEKDANIDLYLKSFSGDPWSCQRIGRGMLRMEHPTITISVCSQPEVLAGLGRNKNFRGRGLLARFLYVVCRQQAGYRQRQVKFIPDAQIQQYRNHVFKLMKMPIGSELKFSNDAQAVWDEFYNDVEMEMRPHGSLETIKDWGSKLPGMVARIAGLLHGAGGYAVDKSIGVSTIDAAAVLGGYFTEHTLAAFSIMGENKDIKSAKKILEYIQREKPGKFKGRDVLRHASFPSMSDIEPGLKILQERGYIREVGGEYSGKGRPAAVSYVINPKLNIGENH